VAGLIVSLDIVTTPWHLPTIEFAVALLTLQAILINRHAGIDLRNRRGA